MDVLKDTGPTNMSGQEAMLFMLMDRIERLEERFDQAKITPTARQVFPMKLFKILMLASLFSYSTSTILSVCDWLQKS